MNIAIIDDLQKERDNLRDILQKYASINNEDIDITTFASAEELLTNYQALQYTVIFLDIYMGGITGIEAAKRIREIDSDTCIVFQTVSMEHQADAFRVHAYDYIEKPAQIKEVFRMMDDLLKRTTIVDSANHFSFYSDKQSYTIPYSDIVAVCASGHYLEITDIAGNVYRPRMTFASITQDFTADRGFLLIMRGNIVNMNYILEFSDGICRLKNGLYLNYSRRSAKSLEQIWQNYIFSRIRSEAMGRES